MVNFDIKTLLLTLATGTSVHGFISGGSHGFGVSGSSFGFSSSSQSSFSFESSSLRREFSGFSGITSLSDSTQQSLINIINSESQSGTISLNSILGRCGTVCSQNSHTRSDLYSFLELAKQRTNDVNIILDTDFYSAFKSLDLSRTITQIDANFAKRFGFCVNNIESILASYLKSVSGQSSITIDINQFRDIFGEYFVQSTISELQTIIQRLFQQVGCYTPLVFTTPSYYEVNAAYIAQEKKRFSHELSMQINRMNQIDVSSFNQVIGRVKNQFGNCRVCTIEADALSNGVYSLVGGHYSASAIKSQISSAVSSFQSSSSMQFSSFGSSGCTNCFQF